MKKIGIILLLILAMLVGTASVEASIRLKGKDSAIKAAIIYQPGESREETYDNKLRVETTALVPSLLGEPFNNSDELKQADVYYRKPYHFYICSVSGISLDLENLTDNVLVVNWGESAFTLGKYSNIPFLGGMKYSDAGDKSVIPNTVIPPKTIVTVTLYLLPRYDRFWGWFDGVANVTTDDSLQGKVTMKVIDGDTSKYYVFTTPHIIFDKAKLEQFRGTPK